jgi:hypothetical protein
MEEKLADDKHYVGGEWYRICDRTGFKIRDNRTRKEWTGLIVRDQSWEIRQPQDTVRGVMDEQSVDDPRPRSLDVFQGPLSTNLTAYCPLGTTVLPLVTSLRMQAGDILYVMNDLYTNSIVTITSVPNTTSVIVAAPGLSWHAASGNDVVDVSAVSPANIYL